LTAAGRGDVLGGLNQQQREAVTHAGGPLLITAGPGTGKTRVVVHRIAYLVGVAGLAPESLAAVTFTNRAADEMRTRTAQLIGEGSARVAIGTFHWLGHRLLRRYGRFTPFGSNFTLLTPRESGRILAGVIRRQLMSHGADTKQRFDDDRLPTDLSRLQDAVSALRNRGSVVSPAGFDVQAAVMAYERELRERRALDLDDLILQTIQLLESHNSIRTRVNHRLSHVLVDEYQDANPQQVRLLQLLVGGKGSITVVGDEDQAIYGWRHADVAEMLHFPDRFPGARIVRLEESYRSTKRILAVSNSLVEHNRLRLGKRIFTQNPAGQKPTVFAAGDASEEAAFVIATVRTLQDAGLNPDNIAVLFRLNAQSRPLEEAFVRGAIPYHIEGLRFYERPEIVRVLDALRVIADPEDRDAWRGLLTRVRGLGARRVALLLPDEGQPLQLLGRDLPGFLPAAARASVRLLTELVHHEAGRPPQSGMLVDTIRQIVAHLDAVLGPLDSAAESESEQANLDELLSVATQYESSRAASRRDFLDHVTLSGGPSSTASGVRLMTLHGAKGSEFDVVFITGLEDGLLPHRKAFEAPDQVEEERRLLYVGMTRPRSRLFLTYARTRAVGGQLTANPPSRFLEEIPPQLLTVEFGVGRRPRDRLSRVDIGDKVAHARWGHGVVVQVEGTGRDSMVSILFLDGSRQRVQLRHAPLQRVQ